jgi:TrmH family RNA methyltransferase
VCRIFQGLGEGIWQWITSVKNPKIKEVRALQSRTKTRREAGVFVVEGVRLAEEAVAAGWHTQLCLYTSELSPRGLDLVRSLSDSKAPVELVAEHVMKSVSDTQSPQGILLVMEQQVLPLPEHPELLLVLDRMQDPGNAGTLIRSAAAAGFDAVFLTEGSVDGFSPKVLRAGMGAHFRMPVLTAPTIEIVELCQLHGLLLWSASVDAGQIYTDANLRAPLAIVIGGEAHGVGEPLHDSSNLVHIPMPGGGESLNAAAAGAVLIFEVVRQRSQK